VLKGFTETGELICTDPNLQVRTTIGQCGPSLYDVSNFVPAGKTLEQTCTPTDTMQAMLVTRYGLFDLNAGTLQTYISHGGIVITEFSASIPVYNLAYGTSYPVPDFSALIGNCQDNINPSTQLNAADPFWVANAPFAAEVETGCGFNLAPLPGVIALGSHSATPNTVTLGYVDNGPGRLWLVESDWADGDPYFNNTSLQMMRYMVTHRK